MRFVSRDRSMHDVSTFPPPPPADDDPYRAPTALVDDAPADVHGAGAVRLEHLRRETGLRAIGVLCLVLGGYFLLVGIVMSQSALTTTVSGIGNQVLGVSLAMLAVALLALATAWGLFLLRPWVRVPAGIVAVATLLASFLVTAPLVGYAAYLTFSAKGLRVLSPDYAAIRAATPALSAWRYPREGLIVLGLFALYPAAIMVFVMINARSAG
jgi:hypothetical protein